MSDWHWIRHGPTHRKEMIGWTDVPADLSDVDAVSRLAKHLPAEAIVVSSDLLRAVQTADAVAGDRRRAAPSPALREIHFGDWEGLHHSQVSAAAPDLSFRFWDQPGDVTAPGGESWNMLCDRVNGFVDGFAGGPVIAVAHLGVILSQVQRALGVSARQAIAHKIDNLSLTHLRKDGARWSVETINLLP